MATDRTHEEAITTTSAWDSAIVKCHLCATPGCRFRAPCGRKHCCDACGADDFVENSVNFLASDGHCVDCSRLDAETLRRSWWEEWQYNANVESTVPVAGVGEEDEEVREEAACLVVPPEDAAGPAPVLLFLAGHGHVDGRQDFFTGGVDLLLQNGALRRQFIIIAPRPMSSSGLLHGVEEWECSWDEEVVWALFTEVLRRLGPSRVDPARLYATGISLGAAGVWHLALRFGEMFAALAPISGRCAWPRGCWPPAAPTPNEITFRRLQSVTLRAYQTQHDNYAGSPVSDILYLTKTLKVERSQLELPGMDPGSTCRVIAQRWPWSAHAGGSALELWCVENPLRDWTGRAKFSDHCLWYRVFPKYEWKLDEFFLDHCVEKEFQWNFDDSHEFAQHRLRSLMSRPLEGTNAEGGVVKRSKCTMQGCPFLAHSRPCFRGYCCHACAKGASHGHRCERILASTVAEAAPVSVVLS